MSRPLPQPDAAGLYGTPNQISGVPSGAFVRLDNCIIRTAGIVEPRRGQPTDGTSGFGTPDSVGDAMTAYSGSVLVHYDGTTLARQNGTSWTDYSGTYAAPDSSMRMKFAIAQERLYFTTSSGVYRLDTVSSTPVAAGQLRPSIDYAASKCDTNTSGFLAANRAVAYRAVLLTKDASGREIVGAPSDRFTLINPASSTATAGNVVRTGGSLVTVTTSTAHGYKFGDTPTLTPGEANFATGVKTITSILSSTSFTYSEAGANVASGVDEAFAYGASRAYLKVLLPSGVTSSHVLRVYRSRVASTASSTPADDMFLVYEAQVTSTDVSNGYATLYDNTPDAMLGPIGYFSPSAEGILRTNDGPVLARDVTTFNDSLVFGRLTEKHRLQVNLLATGGSDGIVSTSTLTVTRGSSSFTITFGTTQNAGTGTACVYTGGTVAGDIEKTALSLVACINAYSSNTIVDARYVSTADDAPGFILLEARDFSATAFTVTCSKPLAWAPTLPSSPAASSTQRIVRNGVAWSKPGQADAVPALNVAEVGDGDDEVLRVVALRDKVVILKERSVWLMGGAYPFFQFDKLDEPVRTVGPDTAAVLNNMVHVLTTQGLCAISDAGVSILSLPIEEELTELLASALSTVRTKAFGFAYDTERYYGLALPTADGDGWCKQIYIWNGLLRLWAGRWLVDRRHAVVEPESDALYLLDGNANVPRKEAKTFRGADYDDGVTATPYVVATYTSAEAGLGFVGSRDVIGATVSEFRTGDRLVRTSLAGTPLTTPREAWVFGGGTGGGYVGTTCPELTSQYSIHGVGDANGNHNLSTHDYFSSAWGDTLYLYQGFKCVVEWVPSVGAAPEAEKMLEEVHLLFRRAAWYNPNTTTTALGDAVARLEVASDASPSFVEAKKLTGTTPFGQGAWGDTPWGSSSGPRNERVVVPREKQRGTYHRVRLTIHQSRAYWKLQGIVPIYGDDGSPRGRR